MPPKPKQRATLGFGSKPTAEAPAPVAAPATQSVSREGKTALPFWVPVAARQQLRIMAAEEDTTMQALMTEALNDLFAKRNKPEIA